MPPTDPPARHAPAAPTTDGPVDGSTPQTATRGDAPVRLERLAAELESLADRWSSVRRTTDGELEQARAALADAQTALRLLSESR